MRLAGLVAARLCLATGARADPSEFEDTATRDLPGAEKHLAALREICLLRCEKLGDLQKAVRQYRARPRP